MSGAQARPKHRKMRIGELLISEGLITEEQLDTALVEQKKLGLKVGRTLVELGYLQEDQLLRCIAMALQVRFLDLPRLQIDRELVQRLAETYARRFLAIVLEDRGGELLVGMSDPSDLLAYDELTRILKCRVRPALVRESDLLEVFERMYRRTEEISSLAEELHAELGESRFDLDHLETEADDTAVVRLLQELFEDALRVNASDIHIEPDEEVLRVRQRVDGVLQEQVMNELRIAPALVLRLKLMASLDISEKRRPQDGRFNMNVRDRSIDVRLSTMPVEHGESVVMRLLDQSDGCLELEQLGLPGALLARFRGLIHRPHGLVLVTGPTGSGKTTTLYAALSELNGAEKKIITVEDPVEYRLPRINQVQVRPKIGVTFASVLRSALRQDPDILLVGEMRDQETAQMAIRAALTGHLVLSTLHTNDAISSGWRLADMGTRGYLAASALQGVVGQRLVRLVCEECAAPRSPDPQQRMRLDALRPGACDTLEFRAGAGCDHCHETGYRGRSGVYELLELDRATLDALRREDAEGYAVAAWASPGFRSLAQCALDYAGEGRTTVEEVLRLAGELETAG